MLKDVQINYLYHFLHSYNTVHNLCTIKTSKRCLPPKKTLASFPRFLMRADTWEMWELFPRAPALFVTKMHFARKITSCSPSRTSWYLWGQRRVRAQNHFSHQSSAVRLGFTKRHFNKVTLLSAPPDKISPGWQMLLTSAWNETRKVNERRDMGGGEGRGGEGIGRGMQGKSYICFFTFNDVYLNKKKKQPK